MKMIFLPWRAFLPALRHLWSTFEQLLMAGGNKALALSMVGLILFWHIYTPIHELLHVGMCLLGGGSVTELALKPQYGGILLAKIFPFIVPDSDYAGQLTGFQTPNYLVYAMVDFAPYVLSLVGVTLVEYVRRSNKSLLFGLAMLLTLVPFMSIPGDYYEAVSLLTTQIAEMTNPALPQGVLISDDLFLSISKLREAGHWNGITGALIAFGCLAAVYLCLVTLSLQVVVARRFYGANFLTPTVTAEVPANTTDSAAEPDEQG